MAEELTLRVITPDKIVLDTMASSVQVPALDGSMGFLRGHAHLVTALDAGLLTFSSGGTEEVLFISGGFAEVRDNTVRIVSEAGERAEQIDEERAKLAEERARRRLDEGRGAGAVQIDVLRAQMALRKARLRMRARGYRGSLV